MWTAGGSRVAGLSWRATPTAGAVAALEFCTKPTSFRSWPSAGHRSPNGCVLWLSTRLHCLGREARRGEAREAEQLSR